MGPFGVSETWWRWAGWALVAAAGCSSAPPAAPLSSCPPRCSSSASPVAGLRVVISESANQVCMTEGGCLGEPLGSVRVAPLQPPIRRALAEALSSVGFELVASDAERDLVAGVEWRGTDTIAVGLSDVHGRLIDQASYRRSLDPCRALPELTWETCWAANFERMKLALSNPLSRSPALLAFARKARGQASEAPTTRAPAARDDVATAPSSAALSERLSDQQIQETVARYREQVQSSCWQPARDARAPTAPTSARVSTSITVGASGSVLDVRTGGDPLGYPRLADCIAAQVRGWRFPATKNATTASIPFVLTGE
ncbi:MAG: AgmX/PglI C-terminal domain-containing protein [Myxococcales bacterium]|nr:MAG: AgmX/PglI C-terminal domain-containing protein [Myxococcales bacterium]